MSLFQKSVVNKYLKNIDNEKVNSAFIKFKEFYGDTERLRNITQLKEENYQEGFLREIFVHTFGYTLNPDKNFDLTTEYKNLNDSRKADAAIIKNGKAIGVIELKSTGTKDLESIKEQAFGYKNNQPECKYIITSNFRIIRFYIDNATEYEEFNLFEISENEFKFLYLILSKESIFSNLPEKLKQETKFHDQEISEKLYKDYKAFKNKIFEYLVSGNPHYDKLTLFKKSQKLLDRFLFVLFAEDCGLIPPNTISKIIEQWKQFDELGEYKTLYSRFQMLFTHLDKGHNYKGWGEIPAYNGGLFLFDEILDNPNLKLPDGLLQNHTSLLSSYDFSSEVDVNILGHIFEHSLNEIEEMELNLQGFKNLEGLQNESKRKKDGIFYTPKYITKYIVENTVGTICNEKKEELQLKNLFIDETYYKKDGKTSEKGKQLYETLQDYKKWLLTLKILDPACGSGAFLNQTLDFLLSEHKEIDNLISELTGDKIRMFDTDKQILENNIYGVDINEESVDIAKLSLWLRTAQKGRTLSDLSGNLKCGNSLIDDKEIAGEKAFDWNIEFKEIMDNGGFDVVLGNPPYVSNKQIQDKNAYKNYKVAVLQFDLYSLFIERSLILTKENGFHSFIIPDSFLGRSSFSEIRKILLTETNLISVFQLNNVFDEASVGSCIYCLSKTKNQNKTLEFLKPENNNISEEIFTYKINIDKEKIKRNGHKILFIENDKYDLIYKLFKGSTINEIMFLWRGEEIGKKSNRIIPEKETTAIQLLVGENIGRYEFKNTINYIKPENVHKNIENYRNEKIIIRQLGDKINASYDNKGCITTQSIYNLSVSDSRFVLKYILAVLNSIPIHFVYKTLFSEKQTFPRILLENIKEFAVPYINKEMQKKVVKKVDLILSLKTKLHKEKENFLNTIKEDKHLQKITKTLENFQELDFEGFKIEISKQKARFVLGKETDQWREYFNTTKQKIIDLQTEINKTDNEINTMVYGLYELTPEEILIIESSTNN